MLIEELISRGCLVFEKQQPIKLDTAASTSPSWKRSSWSDWVSALDSGSISRTFSTGSDESEVSSQGGGSGSSSSSSSSGGGSKRS